MDNTIFCKSFAFRVFHRKSNFHTDNSAGVDRHFFAYMTRGSARIRTEQETVNVECGEVFFIPAGCKYHSYWYGEPGIEFISLGFRHLPEAGKHHYPTQVIACGKEEIALMQQIVSHPTLDSETLGLFYTLAGRLIPKMTFRSPNQKSLLIEHARELLLTDPDQSIPELARRCAVSESALYAAFKKHCDKSILEVRREIVMERAKEQLILTDRTIEELAQALHFSSGAYFRKCFKDFYGISPREMRKQYKL